MKKLLAGLFIAGVVLAPVTALAAPVETANESDLSITFKKGGDDGSEVGKGPFADSLTLTWTPDALAFGSREIDENTTSYPLESATKNGQWVVVNDNRATKELGLGKAWDVSVQMGKLAEDKPGSELALDAELKLKANAVQQYHIGDEWVSVDGKDDLLPQSPNEIGAVTPFEVGKEPADITMTTNLVVPTPAGEAQLGERVSIMKLAADRTEKPAKEGWATKITNQEINFKSLLTQSTLGGKTFKTKVVWTLNKGEL